MVFFRASGHLFLLIWHIQKVQWGPQLDCPSILLTDLVQIVNHFSRSVELPSDQYGPWNDSQSRGDLCFPPPPQRTSGNVWRHYFTSGGARLISHGYRSRMLLNILQCTKQLSQQHIAWHNMSLVLKLGNPSLLGTIHFITWLYFMLQGLVFPGRQFASQF